MAEDSDQSTQTRAGGSAKPETAGGVSIPWHQRLVRATQVRTLAITTVVLGAGLAVLWVAKSVLDIEGDAVFITLLLVPVIVLLAQTGELESISLFGASVALRNLHKDVTEVGQREEKRVAYLGKLAQVLGKDGRNFALLYADVDGLRQATREIYMRQREHSGPAAGEGDRDRTRKREEEIRREIIDQLELSLTDAFYEASLDHAKCDVFRLVEPDIAMIVRSVSLLQAQQIAASGEKLFQEARGRTATTAVYPVMHLPTKLEMTPEELDKAAGEALDKAKKERKDRA